MAGAKLAGWPESAAAQDATPVPIQGQIAFGQPDRTADVYKPLIAGAKLEGQARGYEVLESFAEGRADKQIAEINNWIGSGVKAMTILPLDEKAMQPAIEKAHEAGIVFVSYSDIIPNADGYTVFDSVQGGEMVGEWVGNWINENLGGEAEIASLTADFHETGRQRIGGAEKKIAELAPNAKVVNRTEAVLAPEAFTATQSILQANPNVNVILCIADDGCLGAAQAVRGHRPRSEYRLHRRLGRLARGDEAHPGRGTRSAPPVPSTSSLLAAPPSGCRPTSSRTKSRRTTPASTSW